MVVLNDSSHYSGLVQNSGSVLMEIQRLRTVIYKVFKTLNYRDSFSTVGKPLCYHRHDPCAIPVKGEPWHLQTQPFILLRPENEHQVMIQELTPGHRW